MANPTTLMPSRTLPSIGQPKVPPRTAGPPSPTWTKTGIVFVPGTGQGRNRQKRQAGAVIRPQWHEAAQGRDQIRKGYANARTGLQNAWNVVHASSGIKTRAVATWPPMRASQAIGGGVFGQSFASFPAGSETKGAVRREGLVCPALPHCGGTACNSWQTAELLRNGPRQTTIRPGRSPSRPATARAGQPHAQQTRVHFNPRCDGQTHRQQFEPTTTCVGATRGERRRGTVSSRSFRVPWRTRREAVQDGSDDCGKRDFTQP